MSNGKGDKVAGGYRTKQWEESKLWDEAVILPCKRCKKELKLLKSPGINPATGQEFGCYCGECWKESKKVIGNKEK